MMPQALWHGGNSLWPTYKVQTMMSSSFWRSKVCNEATYIYIHIFYTYIELYIPTYMLHDVYLLVVFVYFNGLLIALVMVYGLVSSTCRRWHLAVCSTSDIGGPSWWALFVLRSRQCLLHSGKHTSTAFFPSPSSEGKGKYASCSTQIPNRINHKKELESAEWGIAQPYATFNHGQILEI